MGTHLIQGVRQPSVALTSPRSLRTLIASTVNTSPSSDLPTIAASLPVWSMPNGRPKASEPMMSNARKFLKWVKPVDKHGISNGEK